MDTTSKDPSHACHGRPPTRNVEQRELESRNDWTLLEQWRNGDEASGQALLKRYTELLVRLFRKKLNNFDDIADLVSETMLGCTRGLDRVRRSGSCRSYVVACAMNNLRLYYRKKAKRDREIGDFADVCIAAPTDPRSPASLVHLRREGQLLVCALRKLPRDQQVALKMMYFEGLNGAEIASVLGIPKQTAYTRIRRGKEKLRAIMQGFDRSPKIADSKMMGLRSWAAQLRNEFSRGSLRVRTPVQWREPG